MSPQRLTKKDNTLKKQSELHCLGYVRGSQPVVHVPPVYAKAFEVVRKIFPKNAKKICFHGLLTKTHKRDFTTEISFKKTS